MNIHNQLAVGLFALAAFFPLAFSSSPAHAQQSASPIAAPRIDGFDVEPTPQLVAGNEIEKRVKTNKHYEVVVRLENGGSQTISYAAEPGFQVGTRVKVENGVLVRDQ